MKYIVRLSLSRGFVLSQKLFYTNLETNFGHLTFPIKISSIAVVHERLYWIWKTDTIINLFGCSALILHPNKINVISGSLILEDLSFWNISGNYIKWTECYSHLEVSYDRQLKQMLEWRYKRWLGGISLILTLFWNSRKAVQVSKLYYDNHTGTQNE
jgi:hypothetical protein